jgi:hypothetical protein
MNAGGTVMADLNDSSQDVLADTPRYDGFRH